jgi:hypothetical protein
MIFKSNFLQQINKVVSFTIVIFHFDLLYNSIERKSDERVLEIFSSKWTMITS